MSERVVNNLVHFQEELKNAGQKLVVVDYTATWCGPCQRIAPVFHEMAQKYKSAVFLKVDVDKCQDLAAAQGVSSMPTFIFYKNKIVLDRISGANPAALENKIKQYYTVVDEDEEAAHQGHMDLTSFIMKGQCEALNESDDHPLSQCLDNGGGYLESDCDEQLIISLAFSQAVKIHSLKIKAPADKGPKNLKLFINQPNTLDFDAASSNVAVQELELTPKDLEGNPVNLRYVKFQNVQNIQVFVRDNQSGGEVTQIDHIQLYGSPITTINMSDFKRVEGKKGEVH